MSISMRLLPLAMAFAFSVSAAGCSQTTDIFDLMNRNKDRPLVETQKQVNKRVVCQSFKFIEWSRQDTSSTQWQAVEHNAALKTFKC